MAPAKRVPTAVLVRLLGCVPRSWLTGAARLQWKGRGFKRLYDLGVSLLRQGDGVIQGGAGRGLRFRVGSGNAGFLLGTTEPLVQQALAALLRPGDTFYDVGANVGFYAVIAARLVGSAGRVVCFEPMPGNVREAQDNVSLNGFANVSIIPVALGARDGRARFLVSARSTHGRLAELGQDVSEPAGEVEVPIRRLDRVVADDDLPRPDVIKMDVEGAEGDVLVGAAETLTRARPVLLIEIHGTNTEVARLLRQSGYRAIVLGSDEPLETAPWYVHVVAVPGERAELLRLVPR